MDEVLEPVLAEKARKVRELHVDFLLEEEFCANPKFLHTFVRAAGKLDPHEIVNVRHSASDQYGEADLVVVYRAENKRKIGLLIENKVRAIFQPNQAQRYRDRGEAGLREGNWDEYWTCLVAPKSYIRPDHGFHIALRLEDIKEWLAPEQRERHQFKAEVIERAIKKAETIGAQVVDIPVTRFRKGYYEFLVNFSRETQIDAFMREPADTWRGETWFRIRSGLLRNGAYVHHKSDKGFVDLTFPDTDANLLRELGQHLEPDMSIHQTGNSAAIRLEVPRIESFSDFEVERGKVQQALTALSRLLAFYNRQCTLIEGILYRAHRVKRPLREDAADGN